MSGKWRCAGAMCVLVTAFAHAAPLPLANTGNNGGLLPDGAVDPNYHLLVSPDPAFPGPNAFVTNNGYPIPPWTANGPNSKWISPRADAGNSNSVGNYTYRYTFDLSHFNPATAQFTGSWLTDNSGIDILLNGVSISPTLTLAAGFTQPMGTFAFSAPIGSNFNACTNALDFVVNNAGGPTGLRVELSGSAAANTPVTVSASFVPNPVFQGSVSTLTFTLTSASGNSAQSCLGFSDTLPAGLAVSGPLNPSQCGGNVSLVGNVLSLANGLLAAGPSSCTMSVNVTANTPGSYPDTDAGNISGRSGNIDTAGVNATLVVLASADLASTATVPPTATAGSTVTIPVTFTNSGPSTASNVIASASLPPGSSGVVVSNGGSYNSATGAVTWPVVATLVSGANLDYSVSYTAPAAGSVAFSATVSSDTGDPNPGNNTFTAIMLIAQIVAVPTISSLALMVLASLLLVSAITRNSWVGKVLWSRRRKNGTTRHSDAGNPRV